MQNDKIEWNQIPNTSNVKDETKEKKPITKKDLKEKWGWK
jgi:hypothetical protein